MATASKQRRLIDAVDDVVRELRTANALAALTLGAPALEHDVAGLQSKTESTKARAQVRNELRRVAREGLGLEEVNRG